MESSLKELAGYRLTRAKEMLSASKSNLEIVIQTFRRDSIFYKRVFEDRNFR